MDLEQAPLVRNVIGHAGLEVVAVGSNQTGRVSDIIEALGAGLTDFNPARFNPARIDDLRAALTSGGSLGNAFLLFAPGDFASAQARNASSNGDELALGDCLDRNAHVFSIEPMPSSLLQLQGGGPGIAGPSDGLVALGQGTTPALIDPTAQPEWATFAPRLRTSKALRDASEVIAGAGQAHTLLIEVYAHPTHGSLGARLYDAIEIVQWLLGTPDRVDAAHVSPVRTRGVHASPAETLRALDGDMTVNLRFADGRAASIVASTRAGRWNRSVTILGDKGRVRVFDDGFAWIDTGGRTIDSTRDPGRIRGSGVSDDAHTHAARAIADQITRTLDSASPPAPPTDVVSILAIAEAALLSARTHESESPATILRMAGTL